MEALSIKEAAMAVNGRVLFGEESTLITFVSTNSKAFQEGGLFVPIVGENVDGHNYIEDAALHGANVCFTDRELTYKEGMAYILVDNTLQALQALGTYYRSKFNIPVIGITGSVGKTTTKEMISAALETKYRVLKTEGNMNSQVGLPLMMLKLETFHEIAVIEMGMSEEGEMERLVRIAKPEAAVLTNIGVSHIAQLKTKENIRKAKLNIINEFKEGSPLFLNGNDPLLYEAAAKNNMDLNPETKEKLDTCKIITYGEGEFDYKASDIIFEDEKTRFTLNESREEIHLNVLGIHNVYNALAALAIAKYYGIEPDIAKEGLRNYRPIAMRGQILEINGMKVIDDSYNASPDSMKSGVEVLKSLSKIKRKIAVLADIKELGEISKQSHYEVGEFLVDQPIDAVITIGEEALEIAKALKDNNSTIQTYSFFNNEGALAFLSEFLDKGDGILIKGSRGMKTDEIVKGLNNL